MLSVNNISKMYGIEPILSRVSFTINRGDRLGLVGPNGCGKTTLLRIITGAEKSDSGSIRLTPAGLRVGYLPQGLTPDDDETLGDFLGLDQDGLSLLGREVEQLAEAFSCAPDRLDLQHAYDLALDHLAVESGRAQRAPEALAGLGLDPFSYATPVSILSGGQKTRLALAQVLLRDPQLLLLDEPTNHLDLEMLEWLEGWLQAFPGGVLVVSHDRAFLDGVATSIVEIDLDTHTARQYAGNYSAYLEQKLADRERQWQAYKDQQEEIHRLQAAAAAVEEKARFRKGGKGDSGDKFAKGFFANRTRSVIRRARQLEARIDRLTHEDRVDKPRQSWQIKAAFSDTPTSGREVLMLDDLAVGYDDHTLLSGINLNLRFGARAALIGPNGAGKTTLLRTIAGRIPPIGGAFRLGAGVKIGYMSQEQEELNPALNALETLQRSAVFPETEARTFLHRFLFSGDDVFVPVGSLSYGERTRLSLARLVAQGCNFLLLDEPINHLDIPSRGRFEQALAEFEGTVLAVVHDRYFISGFASEVWQARGGSLQRHWWD
jgi:ATP-binding cassette, subfamily F, member 3